MSFGKKIGIATLLALLAWLGIAIYRNVRDASDQPAARQRGPVPVEVAEIEIGPISDIRAFSGSLRSPASFVVAPKVGGRVIELAADLADPVLRTQLLARLDDDEHRQSVRQAEAEKEVARATLREAESGLEIARRNLERVSTLRQRGVASESDLDNAQAENLAREAAVEVARARLTRAEAALESARIRLAYTEVRADWREGSMTRVVSARHVDEGDTVAANAPLFTIIELNPINAIIYLAERDYSRINPGQPVTLTTSAYPGREFSGEVVRIAPAFEVDSRQALIEVEVDNEELLLKPGMFIRARIVMETVDGAVMVPEAAIVRREDRTGIFTICDDFETAEWRLVTEGIRSGEMVQVIGEDICGYVVTLGQHLLGDRTPITIPDWSPRDRQTETADES